jgi:hypothetical protein
MEIDEITTASFRSLVMTLRVRSPRPQWVLAMTGERFSYGILGGPLPSNIFRSTGNKTALSSVLDIFGGRDLLFLTMWNSNQRSAGGRLSPK